MAKKTPANYRKSIKNSGKTIYDEIEVGDADLWIPTLQLELLLNEGLRGKVLKDSDNNALPNRTRSKVVKTLACDALGYPAPSSFRKTKPRFPGQQLDIHSQKANNVQPWNEKLSPSRRYAIVQVSADYVVQKVRVVNGQALSLLTTGKVTTKYQARLEIGKEKCELISTRDTTPMIEHVKSEVTIGRHVSPVDDPESATLLSIGAIFERLSTLIGQSFPDPGVDQERNRGAQLHKLICKHLGYQVYGDTGQFPDIRHQMLEVKLQTSPTIDLGLILPNSEENLDVRKLGRHHPQHCDTRYAIFYATTDGATVTLTNLFVTTGKDFFTRMRRFEGNVTNEKIQIRLPRDFFA